MWIKELRFFLRQRINSPKRLALWAYLHRTLQSWIADASPCLRTSRLFRSSPCNHVPGLVFGSTTWLIGIINIFAGSAATVSGIRHGIRRVLRLVSLAAVLPTRNETPIRRFPPKNSRYATVRFGAKRL